MPTIIPSNLKLGDRGEAVRLLQDALVAVAVSPPASARTVVALDDLLGALEAERTDGVFGEATLKTLERFQQAEALDSVTPGALDLPTAEHLNSLVEDRPSDSLRAAMIAAPERRNAFNSLVEPLGVQRLALDRLAQVIATSSSLPEALDRIQADSVTVRGAAALPALFEKLADAELKGGVVDESWFEHGGAPNPRLQTEAETVLKTAFGVLGTGQKMPEDFGDAVAKLMFVQHPTTQVLRDLLQGKSLVEDMHVAGARWPGTPDPRAPDVPTPGIEVPDRLPHWTDFRRFWTAGCVADLRRGLNATAGALSGVLKPQPKTGATITSFDPPCVCAGAMPPQRVKIIGSGFGSKRAGDEVYFDDRQAVVASGQWTDTEIVVEVPAGLDGEICVSVLENTNADQTGLADAVGSANETAQVLEGCFGIRQNLGIGLINTYTPRAECTRSNRLWIGAPSIDSFLANGSNQLARLRLNQRVELNWSTRYADSVTLSVSPVHGAPPAELSPPSRPLAAIGALMLGPAPRRDRWEVEFTLRASNRCGTRTRSLRVAFELQLGVAFLGSGTRCIFHVGALEVLADHLEGSPRGVASGGMGAMAALTLARNFRDPGPLALAWGGVSPTAFIQSGEFDGLSAVTFLISEDATIRKAFEDFENGMYDDLLEGVYATINETMLSYADAGPLEPPPVTIADDDTIVREKMEKAMLDAGMTLGKIFIDSALNSGGTPSSAVSKGAKDVGESVAAVLTDGVANGAKVAIASAGKALFKVNPALGIAFVVAAFLIKAGIEAGMSAAKADKMRKALAERGLFRTQALDRLFDDLLGRLGLMNTTISSPISVSLGAARLESGEPVYFGNFGNLRDARGTSIGSAGFGDILRAVSAIPGAMAPRVVAGATIIDTTSVDYAPLEPLHQLGVDEIYTVHSTMNVLASAAPGQSFNDAGFLTVMRRAERMRSASAALTAGDPFVYWRSSDSPQTPIGSLPARVRHIVPTLSLPWLNAFDFEPGLAAIWQDYGFLRAFDVLAPLKLYPIESEAYAQRRINLRNLLAETSDLITALRVASWRLEHRLNRVRDITLGFSNRREGPRLLMTLPPVEVMEQLRVLKRTIAGVVTDRLQLVRRTHQFELSGIFPGPAVPPTRFTAWYTRYEQHAWTFENVSHVDPSGANDAHPWLEVGTFYPAEWMPAAQVPVVDLTLLTPAR